MAVEAKSTATGIKTDVDTVKKTVAKTAVKKADEKKETAKKAPAKKTATKKAEPKATVVLQYGGREILAKDVLAEATKAFKKGNRGVDIKTIKVYVKPEENAAYYVVNEDLGGKIDL